MGRFAHPPTEVSPLRETHNSVGPTHRGMTPGPVREALGMASPTKRGTSHTFPNSFASYLLEGGYDIRTVLTLPRHKGVRATVCARCSPRWNELHTPLTKHNGRPGHGMHPPRNSTRTSMRQSGTLPGNQGQSPRQPRPSSKICKMVAHRSAAEPLQPAALRRGRGVRWNASLRPRKPGRCGGRE